MSSLESSYDWRLSLSNGRLVLISEEGDGGGIKVDAQKHRSASTRRERSVGGLASREDVTLKFECDAYMWSLRSQLENAARANAPCLVTSMQLEAPQSAENGHDPHTISGTLSEVNYPSYKLSGNAVGLVEITVSADE